MINRYKSNNNSKYSWYLLYIVVRSFDLTIFYKLEKHLLLYLFIWIKFQALWKIMKIESKHREKWNI